MSPGTARGTEIVFCHLHKVDNVHITISSLQCIRRTQSGSRRLFIYLLPVDSRMKCLLGTVGGPPFSKTHFSSILLLHFQFVYSPTFSGPLWQSSCQNQEHRREELMSNMSQTEIKFYEPGWRPDGLSALGFCPLGNTRGALSSLRRLLELDATQEKTVGTTFHGLFMTAGVTNLSRPRVHSNSLTWITPSVEEGQSVCRSVNFTIVCSCNCWILLI